MWGKYIARKIVFKPKFFAAQYYRVAFSELVRAAGISSLKKMPSS